MKVVETKNAPGAFGPYSQAFVTNGFVFASGQIPVNPETGEIPEGIEAQAAQSCKNVGAILEAAGSGFDSIQLRICRILHFKACKKLCCCKGSPEGRSLRNRDYR